MYLPLSEPHQGSFINDLSSSCFVACSLGDFVIHLLFHLSVAYQKYKTVFFVNRNERVRKLLALLPTG